MKQTFNFHFQAPAGHRLHKYFMHVSVKGMCWNDKTRMWVDNTGEWTSSCFECRTLRAFKRVLRKHPHIIGKASLINRYIGFDVRTYKTGY